MPRPPRDLQLMRGNAARQPPANYAAPAVGQRAARIIHHLLGWLLAGSATTLAASGQIEYAVSADITDWRRVLVPTILEIAAVFLILGGYLRACDGDSPALLWLLAAAITGFATWTNLTHGGARAGRIYAAATIVTFVLWLLKLRDRYRTARRAAGLIDAPTAKFRLVRWIVMPRLTHRAWLLAVEYNLRDTDQALHHAQLWHDTAADTLATTTGSRRTRSRAAHHAAAHAVRTCHRTTNPAGPTTTSAAARPGTQPTSRLRRTIVAPADQRESSESDAQASAVPARTPAATHQDRTSRIAVPVQPSQTDPEVGASPSRPGYQPRRPEDQRMYQAWLAAVAAGHEPTGEQLARAAGRENDASGIGRRAARRYRSAHRAMQVATRPSEAA